MTDDELSRLIVHIIAYAGESKTFSMEAMDLIAVEKYEEAHARIKEAEESLHKAHQFHTNLLVYEANNEGALKINCLLIHASTHLSNAELSLDMATKLLAIFNKRREE